MPLLAILGSSDYDDDKEAAMIYILFFFFQFCAEGSLIAEKTPKLWVQMKLNERYLIQVLFDNNILQNKKAFFFF